jgi:Tol biopolymer transport system component
MIRKMFAMAAWSAIAACSSPATTTKRGSATTTLPAELQIGPMKDMVAPREVHLKNVRQLTFGGDNAEAYWSAAGDQLILQSNRAPYKCDQIMTMPAKYGAKATLVSTGKGRTTCSYFVNDDKEIIYASTHEKSDDCPTPPDMSQGYVWALFDYDIYKANADGSNVRRMTDTPGYDAEATVCQKTGAIVFTSTRNGDLDLYRMDADGQNVVQLTHSMGYDGGAFFSPDCSKIVWRSSRPTGAALEDYQRLLKQNLVRPTKLELFVANADGTDTRQITYLGVAAFGPFFHPSGKRILFATNYPNPKGREFDIWAVGIDGTNLERITWADGFDGFPMFSPDGKTLAFSSNRRDVVAGPPDANGKPTEVYRATGTAAGPTDTNVFLAEWTDDWNVPEVRKPDAASAVDRFRDAVDYLADDARQGRGVGTDGLVQAQGWVEGELRAAGVEPLLAASGPQGSGAATFRQPFSVTTALQRGAKTSVKIDGVAVAVEDFAPFSFSTRDGKTVKAAVVDVGWGIVDAGLKQDDYQGKNVKGSIVVVHRFAPNDVKLSARDAAKLGDARYKAFVAKQHGAIGMIVVDDGDLKIDEAKLPPLLPSSAGTDGDAGIPIVALTRKAKAISPAPWKRAEIAVELNPVRTTTDNIIGIIRGGAEPKAAGVVVVGAHLDHLGQGGVGTGSLDTTQGIHNGADDNASGVAALLEVARTLSANKATLHRDVVIVAFSAEEMGVLGSEFLVKNLPTQLAKGKNPGSGNPIVAMLNMDMVGRLRNNALSVLGAESATEWSGLMPDLCASTGIECTIGGSGYGPSDHMPFYVAGIPVLHFFSGSHLDYHRQSDDAATINAAGGAQVAKLVAVTAAAIANRSTGLTYQKTTAPASTTMDLRLTGASLGTVPSYNDEPNQPPGAAISDVVPDGAAAKAGILGGDRIIRIGATEIRNLSDMMFVLQNSKPGDATKVTVMRSGKQLTFDAVLGQRRR